MKTPNDFVMIIATCISVLTCISFSISATDYLIDQCIKFSKRKMNQTCKMDGCCTLLLFHSRLNGSDINKDLTFKDKDQTPKDKDQTFKTKD